MSEYQENFEHIHTSFILNMDMDFFTMMDIAVVENEDTLRPLVRIGEGNLSPIYSISFTTKWIKVETYY